MFRVTYLFLAVFVFILASCGNSMEKTTMAIGKDRYSIEIARTQEELQKGLMNRRTIPANSGMLFVFKEDRRLSFWMKNTFVPLSIAYLSSDGVVKEIYSMIPESLAPVNSKHFVRYALELPKGSFVRSGVHIGDRIAIPDYVNFSIPTATPATVTINPNDQILK